MSNAATKMANRLKGNGQQSVTTTAGKPVDKALREKIVPAIRTLEKQNKGKYAGKPGIHAVYSGLNGELKRMGYDPVSATTQLAAEGLIQTRPCFGGAMVYVHGDMPVYETKGKAHGLLG